jgi:hypothetical protein
MDEREWLAGWSLTTVAVFDEFTRLWVSSVPKKAKGGGRRDKKTAEVVLSRPCLIEMAPGSGFEPET